MNHEASLVQQHRDWWPLELYRATLRLHAAGYIATTRIVQDVTLVTNSLPSWTYHHWNYGPGKHKQLVRNYVNEEEFQRVNSLLKRRSSHKYTSLALALRGAQKNSRSQGWCMLSTVLTLSDLGTTVEVQYRTTEVVLKFAADVIFLRDYILPKLGIDPAKVKQFRFRFANCWIGGPYFSYLVDKTDVIQILGWVEKYDPEFFFRMTRPLLKSCYRRDQFHPFAPAQRSHTYLWQHASTSQIQEIRAWLEKRFDRAGVERPKDFHTRETYVPRGKRSEEEDDE